jgi:hypothetical protein
MNKFVIPSNLLALPNSIQFRSNSINCFYKSYRQRVNKLVCVNREQMSVVRESAYSGRLKKGSRRRLNNALESLVVLCPERKVLNPATQKNFRFRLAFLTLTLPKQITALQEESIHTTLLKPFLQHLERRHKVSKFVWRLERTKAGRLHWHIVIDQCIHYKHIRNGWNKLLRQNRLLDQYAKEHGNYNAPSTDIRSVKSVDQSLKYMRKYLGKEESNEKQMKGRVWDASLVVKRFVFPVIENARYEVEKLLTWVDWSAKGNIISEWFVHVGLDSLRLDREWREWHRKVLGECVMLYDLQLNVANVG